MRPSHIVAFALLAAGCLEYPRLKTCAEFPLGTEGSPEPCDQWCDLMLEACPDSLPSAEGTDPRRACAIECAEAMVPIGTPGERVGNTLECRAEHARLAQSDPAGHCSSATLEGGGVCTDANCEIYCELMATACPERFPDVESCVATCDAYPDVPSQPDTPGNSLQCRAANARAALSDASRCDAADAGGGGVCGDTCEAMCDQIDSHCPDASPYPSRDACEAWCGMLPRDPPGPVATVERNTVECRLYHATFPAAFSPVKHCPHAGVYHADHCGPICDTYCALMSDRCSSTYSDAEACQADCVAQVQAGTPLWPSPDAAVACER